MTLPELSIKRHVLAWMVSGLLVLFGIISYQRIAVDRFPYIEFPIISVLCPNGVYAMGKKNGDRGKNEFAPIPA